MNAKKVREQSVAEIKNGLAAAKKELRTLELQETAKNMGRAPIKTRNLTRDIARMLTILREREIDKK